MVAASTYAQGTVNFVNRIAGVYDAPVTVLGGGLASGGAPDNWVAQLWAGPVGGAIAPVGAPIAFRSSTPGVGYWPGETRTITGVPESGNAQIQVAVWAKSLWGDAGPTSPTASTPGWGTSALLPSVATGGGLTPPTGLVGLTAFSVNPVPEPSIAALGLLGAGLLLIRRKK
jgi:hypothetical protein